MNREIKFRAWDGNFMHYEVDIVNGKHFIDGFNLESVLMQYTGLKDKNGKEIYEGDYNQDGEVVIFCNECNGWQFALYDFPTKDFIFCHNCEGNFMFQDGLSDLEIVGNIYENPELLNP